MGGCRSLQSRLCRLVRTDLMLRCRLVEEVEEVEGLGVNGIPGR